MITLLKPGYAKIMRLFYLEKSIHLHLREIARRTKLHEPSVTRFLSQLEKEGILKSQKDANLKKYTIQKNKKTYAVFELFDIEKQEKLPRMRKRAIAYYLNTLPEQPIFIQLFGSTAKETYKEDSDIDLLLVVNKKIATEDAEKYVDAQTGIRINTIQIKFNDFLKEIKLKEDNVVGSALATGYPLINHLFYYEVFMQ